MYKKHFKMLVNLCYYCNYWKLSIYNALSLSEFIVSRAFEYDGILNDLIPSYFISLEHECNL